MESERKKKTKSIKKKTLKSNPLDLTNIADTVMQIEKEKERTEIEKMRRESTEKTKKQMSQRSEMFLKSFDKLNINLTKFENMAPIDILKQGLKLHDKMLVRVAAEIGLSKIIGDKQTFEVMNKEAKFNQGFIEKLKKDISQRLYSEDLTSSEYNDLVDLFEYLN